jgi:hypothetical protein
MKKVALTAALLGTAALAASRELQAEFWHL